jgi:uncharacterized membrane protein
MNSRNETSQEHVRAADRRRVEGSSDRQTENRIASGLGWFSIGLGLAEIVAPGTVARLAGVPEEGRTKTILRVYGMRELAAGVGILSQDNPAPWVWARVWGDLLDLSSLGKAMLSDDAQRARSGFAAAAIAGITGFDVYCAQKFAARSERSGVSRTDSNDSRSILIDKSPEEVYTFWRDFANLPLVSPQLESVQVTDTNRSHWKLRSSIGNTRPEWDAEITEDRPNEYIAWRSVSTAAPHSGWVSFARATGGRGTKVTVHMDFGGGVGKKLGKLLGALPRELANITLHNLKQLLETGEVVRSDASIHRGMHPARPPEATNREEAL